MKRVRMAGVAMLALTCSWGTAQAGMSSYEVNSTGKIDCKTRSGADAPHGLWTNKYRVGGSLFDSCKQYFDFQEGSSLNVDGDKARLKATAVNPYGVTAEIDFHFENPMSYGDWKDTGGMVKGAELGNEADWTFYEKGAGRIKISREHKIGGVLLKVVDKFKLDLKDDTSFQFGLGANDKTRAMGASGWLDINRWVHKLVVYEWSTMDKLWKVSHRVWHGLYDWKLGDHWDLNMELSAVPLPASLVLFLTGLLGLAAFNSRKRHSWTVTA